MKLRIALAALFGVLVLATACGDSDRSSERLEATATPTLAANEVSESGDQTAEPIRVIATIYPLGYFAERVGGDFVDVDVLVSPGFEAHGYELTASELQELGDADVIVMNGIGLEPWMNRAIEAVEDELSAIVVEASDAALAMEGEVHMHDDEEGHHDDEEAHDDHGDEEGHHHESGLDPHFWLSPTLAARQVERIRDAFVSADAANAATYRQHADELIAELQELDQEFVEGLGACRHDHFVTSHAAYGYLAAQYGLEQIALAGFSPDVEPSPQRLASVTDRVTDLGLGHVLVEPVLSDRLAQTVARETGIELRPIHAIESVTESELQAHDDYLGLMRDNLAGLRIALECE